MTNTELQGGDGDRLALEARPAPEGREACLVGWVRAGSWEDEGIAEWMSPGPHVHLLGGGGRAFWLEAGISRASWVMVSVALVTIFLAG